MKYSQRIPSLLLLVVICVHDVRATCSSVNKSVGSIENIDVGTGRVLFPWYFPWLPQFRGVDLSERFNSIRAPEDTGYFMTRDAIAATTGQKFMVDISGLQNALKKGCSKIFRIEALRCVEKVAIPALESAIGLFVSNVRQIGSIEFEVEGETPKLPTLLPVKDQITRLCFNQAKKQCPNCFRFNHTLCNCSSERVKLSDYHTFLFEKWTEIKILRSNSQHGCPSSASVRI
ncbi:ABCA12 [Lepeophtheirus salmonis]|uniref:ABCA12 n=1 Tax=Lepeophtheirus salmonis TaxID=72036 RepID=A0A7R8CIN1_LEPSM|nr:ABCA12 [Lepeophtheirus salmonis]CAF2779704.1 ABCA12 [Lepeophtheirus salmonis]